MINYFTRVKKNVQKNAEIVSRLLGWNAKNDETRAKSTPDIRDMRSVAGLSMLDLSNKDTVPISKSHLKSVVADTQSVTVLRSAEFDNIPMLQGVGTLTQNDEFAIDSDSRLLGEAQERLLSPRMLQDDEHEDYRAFFARPAISANGTQELARSASLMSRSSFATSSGVESSKKSMKSSNIFLDMAEDGATTPRMFSSLMMVMDDLFMTGSISNSTNMSTTSKSDLVAEAGLPEARVFPRVSWLQREATGFRANARHIGCQPAAALATWCDGIIAKTP